MSIEIAQRDDLLPIKRSTARKLATIRQELITGRATIQAQESLLGYQAACKIDNGYALASHTASNAAQLHAEISQATMDNPYLEMTLRGIEADVAKTARSVIAGYMAC